MTVRRPQIGTRRLGTVANPEVVRIDRDPASGNIVYMSRSGRFWRVDPMTGVSTTTETSYTATGDHRGMAFGSDGTLYTMSTTGGPSAISAVIHKGVANGATRTWTTMATSASYPTGGTNFDHSYAGLAVSPDNQFLYITSGSRTDHGEVQTGQREVPLTSAIFRLPVNSSGLNLPNDAAGLANYLFADGLRNTYDVAFNADGELFGADNGPDIDFLDEINLIRQGMHYGFPWRYGAEANPVLDPQYTPQGDLRLHAGFQAVDKNLYVYDAQFPAAPAGVAFVDPIMNKGPDQDKFRAGRTGAVQDASNLGMSLPGITGHRSPLGLAFDTKGALCGEYFKSGFLVSFGAFLDVLQDGGQDLALLQMTKVGTGYEMTTTQLVAGFAAPIDSVLVDNKIYIVEYGAAGNVYEITLPLPAR